MSKDEVKVQARKTFLEPAVDAADGYARPDMKPFMLDRQRASELAANGLVEILGADADKAAEPAAAAAVAPEPTASKGASVRVTDKRGKRGRR